MVRSIIPPRSAVPAASPVRVTIRAKVSGAALYLGTNRDFCLGTGCDPAAAKLRAIWVEFRGVVRVAVKSVVPAKAGIDPLFGSREADGWVPAFAGTAVRNEKGARQCRAP